MANKKFTIPYFVVLLTTFVVLVAGIIVTAFCGLNLGFKEAGGTQIKVNLDSAILSEARVAAENVLSENKITIDSIIVEDKETTSYLVVNIADKSIANLDAVKTEIASTLAIDSAAVTSNVVKSTIKSDVYLAIGLTIIGLLVALFLFGLFRYKLAGGLALGFAFLVQVMLPLSIVFITRVQLSIAGIATIVISALIASLFASIILEKYRGQTRGKDLDDGEEQLVMGEITKSTLEPIIFTIAGILIPAVMIMFIGATSALMLGLVIVISLIALAFNMLLVLPKTNIALCEIARLRLEAYLSKNNSPAPAKDKTKKKK